MARSRNPYVRPTALSLLKKRFRRTEVTTLPSITVFADLLGFTDSLEQAYKRDDAERLLGSLRGAFDKALPALRSSKGYDWYTKIFTDNIALGFPVSYIDEGKTELQFVLSKLGLFQLEMACAGFFLRGGIAVGQLYMDRDIVFGDGIIEAYLAESKLARDPRIVLAKSTRPVLFDQLTVYPEDPNPEMTKASSDHSYESFRDLILEDADGQLFLNYLGASLFESLGSFKKFKSRLKTHRDVVQTKLKEFARNPRVWSKYLWVANYHNFFCTNVADFDEEMAKLIVNVDDFHIVPAKLPSTRRAARRHARK